MRDEKGDDEEIVILNATFFSIYKEPEGRSVPEGKPVAVRGWRGREDAVAVIERARQRFRQAR